MAGISSIFGGYGFCEIAGCLGLLFFFVVLSSVFSRKYGRRSYVSPYMGGGSLGQSHHSFGGGSFGHSGGFHGGGGGFHCACACAGGGVR